MQYIRFLAGLIFIGYGSSMILKRAFGITIPPLAIEILGGMLLVFVGLMLLTKNK